MKSFVSVSISTADFKISRRVHHLAHAWHLLQAPSAPLPATFLGAITSQLLRLTDPMRTTFDAASGSWYGATDSGGGGGGGGPSDAASDTSAETMGAPTLRVLGRAIGHTGLAAIDQLLGHRIQQARPSMCCPHREAQGTPALGTPDSRRHRNTL